MVIIGKIIVVGVLLLFGVILLVYGFTVLKRKRLIENTPTSKIRSIAMGFVEIFGVVVAMKGKTFKSPFTEKDCVYYEYKIDEFRGGKNKRWVTIKSGEEKSNFSVKDDTGAVLVDPNDAAMELTKSYSFESGFGNDPPENVKNFLKGINMNFEGVFGMNRRLRYSEYIIRPGQNVYITGTAGDNPKVKEGTAVKGVDDVMIQAGSNKNLYFICDKPEKEVLKRLKWTSLGLLATGALFTIIGLVVIFK